MARILSIVPAAALVSSCAAAIPFEPAGSAVAPLSGDIVPAHDPVLIRERNTYYAYSTGLRDRLPLMARASDDLVDWYALPSPLDILPGWAREMVPGAQGMWAPDIARVNGRYRLYYSVSTFGSRRSAIGLATTSTLDPSLPNYGWRDEGLVVNSTDAVDFNAIDPNFFEDEDGRQWLLFGSFWGGLKLIELDTESGKPKAGAELHSLARRGGDEGYAIEAPFLVHRGGWYYLIASFDHCCRGANSDYKLAVGRSREVIGPYADRESKPMMEGGGSILLQARPDDRFRGPGHAGYFRDRDGKEYLIYHAYDRDRGGAQTLRLSRLQWDADDWPVIAIRQEAWQ